MTLYMKCTTDKYELPIAVAESPGELLKCWELLLIVFSAV